MRLEEFWGVGPKTAQRLRETLGAERAVEAIESGEVRALVDAGVARGRATRILRRANGAAGMERLATGDAREVYDELLSLAATYAPTAHAADRVRVLTPLSDRDAAAERIDDVLAVREAWEELPERDREDVVAAFERYDDAGATRRAAVDVAETLRSVGLAATLSPALASFDGDAVSDAATALDALDGVPPGADLDAVDPDDLRVGKGADEELDRLRERLAAAEALADSALDVLETVRAEVRGREGFREAVVEHVADEVGLPPAEVRSVAPDEAADAADFVSATLRALADDLDDRVADREEGVRADLEFAVGAAADELAAVADAVDDAAFTLGLARFAAAHDLRRPRLVDSGLAVREARNLFLDGAVQPITYAVGDHGLGGDDSPPSGDRVTVLTGANSGGKTTLLETLCSVALLASMGLPVPAAEAAVGAFDSVVFHRRHASFNAGVLESTLNSVVPPLTADGRTLMLVDEFEAITEPGRAADLLNGLVDATVEREALGVYVTHLAEDLSPLPEAARIDGIFAQGLTADLELRVDYQPRFGTLGKSTPEFIVSRLIADADDPGVEVAFRSLAEAVGEEAVQRTLSDAEWAGGE